MDPMERADALEARQMELYEVARQAERLPPDDQFKLLDDLDAVELQRMDLMLTAARDSSEFNHCPHIRDKLIDGHLAKRTRIVESQRARRLALQAIS